MCALVLSRSVDDVGKWEGDRIAAVIFPTADTVQLIRDLVEKGSKERLVMCVNPQWSLSGNVVSDFGIGAPSKRAEVFIKNFCDVFSIQTLTVLGDAITVMRVYPGGWQIHWTNPPDTGRSRMLSADYMQPSYARIQELLRAQQGSRTSMSWVDRVRSRCVHLLEMWQ